jgi:hypothetical protein
MIDSKTVVLSSFSLCFRDLNDATDIAVDMATQSVDNTTQRKFENLRAKLAAMHYYQVSAAAPRRSAAVPS